MDHSVVQILHVERNQVFARVLLTQDILLCIVPTVASPSERLLLCVNNQGRDIGQIQHTLVCQLQDSIRNSNGNRRAALERLLLLINLHVFAKELRNEDSK